MGKHFFLISIGLFCLLFTASGQNARALKSKGDTYFEHKKFQEALSFYRQYYNTQKDDEEIIFKLGVCFFETNQLTEAKKFFNYNISNSKKPNPDSYIYLARCWHAENNFREAVVNYKLFLKNIKPTHPDRAWVKEAIRRCATGLRISGQDQLAFVENIGEHVNSGADDFKPVLSPNYDDKLYFSSNREGSVGGARNAGGFKDEKFGHHNSDMYSTHLANGEWTAATPFNPFLNTARNEIVLDFNSSGLVMFYFKGNDYSRGQILVDTFKANEKERNLFSDPFFGPIIGENGDEAPHFFNDTTLIFASNRAGGYGGMDIYLSVFSEGSWSLPENLGPVINTPFDETSPFLARNGRTLYFSSNNRNSIGGLDVFKAEFDENKLQWKTPENLGIPINSSEDDTHFRLSRKGLQSYFSSSRKNGFGKRDLYIAYFKAVQKEQEPHSDLLTFNDVKIFRNLRNKDGLGSIGSGLSDPYNSRPLYSEEDIMEYSFDPIYYESDDQVLTPSNMKILEKLAGVLKKHPQLKVELTSNSDETGPSEFDLYFSIKRVEKAGQFLLANGVGQGQIILKGVGSKYPVALNNINGKPNLIGQRLNRRIDITVHNDIDLPIRVSVNEPKVGVLLQVEDHDYYLKLKKGLSYKVQIAATKQMYNNRQLLSRFADAMIEKPLDSNYYKYTVGLYQTFSSANELLKEIEKAGIADAFIVPYIDGLRATNDDTKMYATAYPDLLKYIASRDQK